MDYSASIEWLFKQFPSYQQIGKKAYKPDLGNIIELCNHLHLDYNSLKYVHVAGTNGKGSTTNLLASICIEADLKTGVFTSPHLLDFRERIAITVK
jgi:dihydrofolate synthase/folylpolyglutamate synthase